MDEPRSIASIGDHRAWVVRDASDDNVDEILDIVAASESGSKRYTALNRNDIGHGVSFGRWQFNQGRGNLGALLDKMYRADPVLFVQLTYGDSAANRNPDALVR